MGANTKIISVEGNIGSGKTTFLDYIERKHGAKVYKERPDDNEYLTLFYQDQAKYALDLQLRFLEIRRDIIREIEKGNEEYVFMERSAWSEHEVFVKNMLKTGLMNKNDYDVYLNRFKQIDWPKNNSIVCLEVDTEECNRRISRRGRKAELNKNSSNAIDKDYLESIAIRTKMHVMKQFCLGTEVIYYRPDNLETTLPEDMPYYSLLVEINKLIIKDNSQSRFMFD